MAFPQGGVTDEAGLDKFIDAQIEAELRRESDYLFTLQVRDYLVKKADLKMPAAFLKRWLYTINEGKFTMEQIEKDFAQFVDMMRWNLIQKHFVSEMKLEVTPEEAKNEAKAMAAQQFAYYGMNQVNDETLENYAQSILGNKEENRKIYDRLFERKVIDAVTPQITVVEKEISADDFGKLAQEAQ